MRRVLFCLTILLLHAAAAEAALIERIVWDSPVPIEDHRRLVKVTEGEPLRMAQVRRTVRLLYATGRFEQVVLSVSPGSDAERFVLTVTARPLFFIEDISISGNGALSDDRIKLAGGLRRFAPFSESGLERIRDEVLFAYRSEGYADAALSIEVRRRSDTTVDLLLSVREGDRRRIRAIKVAGTVLASEKRELENRLFLSDAFAPLTDEAMRTLGEAVEIYFRQRGYLDVGVKHFARPNGTVVLTVNRGPRYHLRFKGVRTFAEATMRQVAEHIEQWQHNTDALVDRLTRFYHAAGFPDALIVPTVEDPADRKAVIITVQVTEGERRFLDGIVFSGVQSETAEELKAQILDYVDARLEAEEFPEILLNRTVIGGGYRDTDGARVTTLERTNGDRAVFPGTRYALPGAYTADIAVFLKNLYISRGHLAVRIDHVEVRRDGALRYLDVGIVEGPRTILTWIGVETGDPELDEELLAELDIATNVPFDPSIEDRTVARLEEQMRLRGFLFARIVPQRIDEGISTRLLFAIEDLFPVRLGELVVSGNVVTAEPVVRSLVRIDPGALLTGKLLQEARRDLLATGAFDMVDIAILDRTAPGDRKDIVVVVSEAWRFRLEIGAGIATDEGGRIFGSFEYKNILGRVLTLRLSYKFAHKIPWFMSTDLEEYFLDELSFIERFDRTVNAAFIVPDLYFLPFSLGLQAEVFHIHDSRSSGGLPYLLDKNGMLVSVYKRFGDHYFLSLNTELSRQDEETYHADKTGADRFEQTLRYLLSPEIEGWADYRNSPVSPDRGFKVGLRVRNVTALAGNDTKYTLVENYASLYLPLQYRQTASGDYEPRDTFVWHAFLKYGLLLHHDGTLTPDDALKLGGSTSVRGFAQNSMIPADDTDGVREGKYFFFVRNELRSKIRDRFFLVTFFDAGNLWEEIGNIGKGDLLRYGAGGGLMIATPIGSINLQAGFNLFPRDDPVLDYREDLWSFHFFISSF